MFDIKDLIPHFQSAEEKQFLQVLIESNRVIYSWGWDEMWVWRGDTKNPASEKDAYCMLGEEFHGKMRTAFGPVLCFPTSAGFVVDLLACGLDVEIAKKIPFADDYLPSLVAGAREQNPNGKIGTVIQFQPKSDQEEVREDKPLLKKNWFIWTLWPNDHGHWQMQGLVYVSEGSAAADRLLLQFAGYMVKVLPEGAKP